MRPNRDSAYTLCPECGAPQVGGMNCWEQFGAILALEWQDSALLAKHFLTVACYNLQHPARFTDEALVGLRAAFVDYIDRGVTTAEIRTRIAHMVEGQQRVLRKDEESRPKLRHWRMTISDVYVPEHPEGAAERVKAWAASIRQEM
jgi:hypothetical protein